MTKSLEPAISPSPANWLVHTHQEPPMLVGAFVPETFPAVVRVLNPFTGATGQKKSWTAVAGRMGVDLDGTTVGERLSMDFSALTGDMINVDFGTLDRDVAAALADVLGRHTATNDNCYFAVWRGYSDIREDLAAAPLVVLPPEREMYLLEGPVEAAVETVDEQDSRRSLRWWPADQAWCVGNDLYADSVYVSGSHECVSEIMADPRLETIAVGPADVHPGIYA